MHTDIADTSDMPDGANARGRDNLAGDHGQTLSATLAGPANQAAAAGTESAAPASPLTAPSGQAPAHTLAMPALAAADCMNPVVLRCV